MRGRERKGKEKEDERKGVEIEIRVRTHTPDTSGGCTALAKQTTSKQRAILAKQSRKRARAKWMR